MTNRIGLAFRIAVDATPDDFLNDIPVWLFKEWSDCGIEIQFEPFGESGCYLIMSGPEDVMNPLIKSLEVVSAGELSMPWTGAVAEA